jgi:DNA-binding XRE family transcriptional regulator
MRNLSGRAVDSTSMRYLLTYGDRETRRAADAMQERDGHQRRRDNRSVEVPRLRHLRQNMGLTQRDLGSLAELSQSTVFRLEKGQRGYASTIRKLATALGMSTRELLSGRRLE